MKPRRKYLQNLNPFELATVSEIYKYRWCRENAIISCSCTYELYTHSFWMYRNKLHRRFCPSQHWPLVCGMQKIWRTSLQFRTSFSSVFLSESIAEISNPVRTFGCSGNAPDLYTRVETSSLRRVTGIKYAFKGISDECLNWTFFQILINKYLLLFFQKFCRLLTLNLKLIQHPEWQ